MDSKDVAELDRGAQQASTGETPAVLEHEILEDVLVEEVSIDGMCGVY